MSITGKEIKSIIDEYGLIQVFDDGNKRYLAFGFNDEQGCILKSQPQNLFYCRMLVLYGKCKLFSI